MKMYTGLFVVVCLFGLTSCSLNVGRREYFGYRQARVTVVESTIASTDTVLATGNAQFDVPRVSYVPVIVPWYDNISLYGGFASSFGYPHFGAYASVGFGLNTYSVGSPWFYDMYYSRYSHNAFTGGNRRNYNRNRYYYDNLRNWGYAPGSSQNYYYYSSNAAPQSTLPSTPTKRSMALRDFGVQRPYNNPITALTNGTQPNANTPAIHQDRNIRQRDLLRSNEGFRNENTRSEPRFNDFGSRTNTAPSKSGTMQSSISSSKFNDKPVGGRIR